MRHITPPLLWRYATECNGWPPCDQIRNSPGRQREEFYLDTCLTLPDLKNKLMKTTIITFRTTGLCFERLTNYQLGHGCLTYIYIVWSCIVGTGLGLPVFLSSAFCVIFPPRLRAQLSSTLIFTSLGGVRAIKTLCILKGVCLSHCIIFPMD
jgi:hypothetical protein